MRDETSAGERRWPGAASFPALSGGAGRCSPARSYLEMLGFLLLSLILQGAGPLVGRIEGGVVVDLGLGDTAPLSEVTVTLTHQDQNREREVVTGEDGQYVFQNLPLGGYTVKPHKDGYRARGAQEAEATVSVDQTQVVIPPFHLVPIGE